MRALLRSLTALPGVIPGVNWVPAALTAVVAPKLAVEAPDAANVRNVLTFKPSHDLPDAQYDAT